MIIDLFELKKAGIEEQSFYFEYETGEVLSTLPEVQVKMPIKVNGNVSLTGKHSAYIECEIVFTLSGECTRCLKQTENSYSAEIAFECDDQSEMVKVVNDKISLDKIVEDTVILNMPINFLCSEDCKGICLGCGVNLNDEDCKCNNE